MKINKGVALLLERMKTNPEEFKETGGLRWTNLLVEHDVLLDHPERKIVRPISFNREVMRRLLTGYDLERKGGGISRAQLLKELLPGLDKLFSMEYSKYGEEIKEKYNE
jgi:hypothetical protein